MTAVPDRFRHTRASTKKSRHGCDRCKQKHKKCDEADPTCGLCLRDGAVCNYPAKKVKVLGRNHLRRIHPATSGTAIAPHGHSQAAALSLVQCLQPPSALFHGLSPAESQYLDRFRAHVCPGLIAQGHASAFWHRAVLRESARDPCIRDCLVGLGALDLALATRDIQDEPDAGSQLVPLYKTRVTGSLEHRRHVAQAARSYSHSLSTLRNRLSNIGDEPSPSMVRTAVLASMLFVAFESMQGNGEAADRLFATFLRTFYKNVLSGLQPPPSKLESHTSRAAAALDDDGVHYGEMFMLRVAALRGLCAPTQPTNPRYNHGPELFHPFRYDRSRVPVPNMGTSLEEAGYLWEKNISYTFTFFTQVYQTLLYSRQDKVPLTSAKLHQLLEDQVAARTQLRDWHNYLEQRLASLNQMRSSKTILLYKKSHSIRIISSRAILVYVNAMLDPTEFAWDEQADECEYLLDTFDAIVGWAIEVAAPMLERAFDDQLSYLLHTIVAKCRDLAVRQKGLAIIRRVAQLALRLGNWETITNLVRMRATCLAEEAGRRPPPDGVIPLESRFWWMTCAWNPGHTELTMVVRRMGGERAGVDEHITASLADFETWAHEPSSVLSLRPKQQQPPIDNPAPATADA